MYPQVFGKYVLERELARGGMARVVLATLRGAGGFEKKLVVKQIRDELASDDDFVRRFVEEAKTTVALAHPNIVTVYELGVELGTYFLAMELVEGVSVAELLRGPDGERRGLSPEQGAYVGVELCRALDYAHRMHVVHRDVTPRNVMVDEEGQIKVIDFGIATPVATAPSGEGVFGSPGHMPPEQIAGGELTPAADVFAVAVLLMELWTGKAPFRRKENEEIDAAMQAPHPRPSDHDARLLPLDEVIAAAMSLDAASRPQNADDLGRALRKFLSGIDLGDVARSLGDRVRTVRQRPPGARADDRPVLQRPPSRPSATQMGTKTFAAREEVAGTRRLPASAPPAAPKEIETVATRPLESGPRKEREAGSKRGVWLAGLAVIALAGSVYVAERGGAAKSATAPATATAREPALALAPESAPATESAPAPAPAPAPLDPSDPSDPPQLTLLGAHAQASIDGAPRRPCPVHAVLDPGPHAILFSYPATGESKGETVTLRARDRLTLRADFTGAMPTIRVQH
jgi:tRNA A-37 threonylcarbamoyl transferase component Bud32